MDRFRANKHGVATGIFCAAGYTHATLGQSFAESANARWVSTAVSLGLTGLALMGLERKHQYALAMVGELRDSNHEDRRPAVEAMLHRFAQANGHSAHFPAWIKALNYGLKDPKFVTMLANAAGHPDPSVQRSEAEKIAQYPLVGTALRALLTEACETYASRAHAVTKELTLRCAKMDLTMADAKKLYADIELGDKNGTAKLFFGAEQLAGFDQKRREARRLGSLDRRLSFRSTKLAATDLAPEVRTRHELIKQKTEAKIHAYMKEHVLDGCEPPAPDQADEHSRHLMNVDPQETVAEACASALLSGVARFDVSAAEVSRLADDYVRQDRWADAAA
jgi:hypothetical protein